MRNIFKGIKRPCKSPEVWQYRFQRLPYEEEEGKKAGLEL